MFLLDEEWRTCMSVVIAFRDCCARPDLNGNHFLLSDHLVCVAQCWGDYNGDEREQLYFLGGLCHDAGKARTLWQHKLNAVRRPIHAAPSAVIFAWYADLLLKSWSQKSSFPKSDQALRIVDILKIIRDICDHHGELKDIDAKCPWDGILESDFVFDDIDLVGFHQFVSQFYDGLQNQSPPSSEAIMRTKSAFKNRWKGWYGKELLTSPRLISKMTGTSSKNVNSRLSFRDRTASFIAGDRFDAGQIEKHGLVLDSIPGAIVCLGDYCAEAARSKETLDSGTQPINQKRKQAQEDTLEAYRANPHSPAYSLSLPTGLGKTLTATRIALEACLIGNRSRIIYAAPYMSILSQATREIGLSTGLEVLQHDHLAMLTEEIPDDKDILVLESWQAPVVTTTFNQLFRALFPRRAQDLIRLPALQDAFIIIDEPQIIDTAIWNLFLTQLEMALEIYNCQVLFVSATLPPFRFGMVKTPPLPLAVTVDPPNRYAMECLTTPVSEDDTVAMIMLSSAKHLGIVMNTIADACAIYRKLRQALTDEGKAVEVQTALFEDIDGQTSATHHRLFMLNGMMTPIHKFVIIQASSSALTQTIIPTTMVATQTLEAGIDNSYDEGFRARPIWPSVIQFGGRVNRHGGKDIGRVHVIKFLRNGEKDTRPYVYTSRIEREESDRIMDNCDAWPENVCIQKLTDYYEQCFIRNNATAMLNKYENVARGCWSEFSGMAPFSDDYYRDSVFIPWPSRNQLTRIRDSMTSNGESTNSKSLPISRILTLMDQFSFREVDEIYDFYSDRDLMKSLSFAERKRFLALMQQFVVAVGGKLRSLSISADNRPIRRLCDKASYSAETGLGHHLGHEDKEAYY